MNRRNLLYSVGVIGSVGVGNAITARPASAQSTVDSFEVADETFETTTGTLEELWLQRIHVDASWSGFDEPAETLFWDLEITHNGRTEPGITAAESDVAAIGYDGTVETELPPVDLISAFGPEAFEVESEGDSKSFDLEFTLESTVVGAGGQEIRETETGDATLTVEFLEGDDESLAENVTIDGAVGDQSIAIGNENDSPVDVTIDWRPPGEGTGAEETYTVSSGETKDASHGQQTFEDVLTIEGTF